MAPPRPSSGSAVLLLLDINETLIRTGALSAVQRLSEARELSGFVALCESLTERFARLHVVLLTGNSFEYARRVEEPLGLKNVAGLELSIVSENGLIGRSFQEGDLWHLEPTPAYHSEAALFRRRVAASPRLAGRYYTQGNEVRITLKPVANEFTADELSELRQALPAGDDAAVRGYFHRYYVDVDPREVVLDGAHVPFSGKYWAARRLIGAAVDPVVVGIGDSASDLPMLEAVLESSGHAFWVSNADDDLRLAGVRRLGKPFTAGVNEALAQLMPR